jgi:serine/threonine protein kinase
MQELSEFKANFDPNSFLGREIANVTLVELLGRGAMGAVYVAFQKSLKRKVALKIFPKASSNLSDMRVLFRDEAETVAVLNHPNIAPVFDMGETPDVLFIMMQLIVGENLRSLIRRHLLHPLPSRRTVPLNKVLQIMIQVLDGLDYAHRENVIHQDIKPANIIIEERSGRPGIVDFGIARTEFSANEHSRYVLGTPLYMSPEQITGIQTDCRSDIYSAGMVLYEALVGKIPVKTSSLDQLLAMKASSTESIFSCNPSSSSEVIDDELEKIILKATAPRREDRYQICAAFREDLKKYASARMLSVL